MKVRIRDTSGDRIQDFHENKKRKLTIRLTRTSDRIRRNELKASSREVVAAEKNGALNQAGNRRGLHMRDEPPEEASDRMRKIRAMRKFYNKQMPVQQCNGCAYSSACPQFKAGYECAFLPFFNSHKVQTIEDVFDYMKSMCEANMHRAHWALTAETLSGGAPSLETSEAFNLAFTQLKQLYELATKSEETLEFETSDGGIIREIFGNLGALVKDTKKAQSEPIDIGPSPVHRPKNDDLLLMDKEMNEAEVNTGLATEFARDEILSRVTKKGKSVLPEVTISNAR